MMRLDHIAITDDDSALDHVLELSNIAWPAVSLKRAYRILPETQAGAVFAVRVALYKVMRQNRDVSIAFAQSRKLYVRNVEPVKEVGAKPVVGDRCFERGVCTGHYSRVKPLLLRSAEPAKPTIFHDTQEFRLQLQRELRYFVKEDGPGTRNLEQPALERAGVGECTRFVPEQLTLEKRFRNRCAVDGNERLGSARAGGVDPAGEQLFSRARLTNDQNGQAAARRYLSRKGDDITNGWALADNVRAPAVGRRLLRSG